MTQSLREAAKQMLEALEEDHPSEVGHCAICRARVDLRAALAAPADERDARFTADEVGALTDYLAGKKAIRYDRLYDYASKHHLDYNELCAAVRGAIETSSQSGDTHG